MLFRNDLNGIKFGREYLHIQLFKLSFAIINNAL